jgi:hypothetical protein
LEPAATEEYIDYLVEVGQVEEAAKQLCRVLNDEVFLTSFFHFLIS